ncbi:hypothetical protein N1031_17255 [Herbiconiux moechotypicola]|uniref:Depolymerase 2 capsule K5-specific C-terminal domain-containing protein n=1 Tax=Herbiconiux moechotypicola TaxID=637393 RepID=A0ABN3DR75_9MICO|nr:hypothetical protein [Herbiconiux moechotypicola]MCS5731512.1 hypothetical protein [Herbiconiux moechotypicola]
MPDLNDAGRIARRGLLAGALALGAAPLAGAFRSADSSEGPFIPEGQRGVPSGVAALDAEGNVLTGSPRPRILAERRRVDAIAYVADPEQYDGIDPTGESDSSEGLNALIATLPAGATLVIPPGRYLLDEPLQNLEDDGTTTKSLSLRGFGATLVRTGAGAGIIFRGGFETVFTPTALPLAIGIPGQDSIDGNNLTPGTEIELRAVPPGWRVGDIVKLVADDSAKGARVTKLSDPDGDRLNRVGQFLVIAEIDGRKVRLFGSLRDDFVTNVRVARMSEATISIEGLEFDMTDGALANQDWSSEHIRISSMIAPKVSAIRIRRGNGMGVQFVSCYGFSFRDSVVQRLIDDPVNGRFGYAVMNSQSFGGAVDGCVFSQVRHAYTDGVVGSAANEPTLARYGRPEFTSVSNSVCTAATTSAWNTHHGGRGTSFVNCTAIGGRSAFALRGRGHRILGGLARDVNGPAVAFYVDNAQADCDSHLVDGLSVENVATVLRSNLVGEQECSSVVNVTARGVSRRVMDLRGSRIRADNWWVEMGPKIDNADDEALISLVRDCSLEASGIVIDTTRATEITGPRLTVFSADGGAEESQTLDVRQAVLHNLDSQFGQLVTNGPSATKYITMEADEPFIPAADRPIVDDAGAGGSVSYNVRSTSANSNSLVVRGADVESPRTARLIALCRGTVFLDCIPDSRGRTVANLLPGDGFGQQLFVRNSGGDGDLTVDHGPDANTDLAGRRSSVLQPGSSMHLAWLPADGSGGGRWTQMS